MKVLITGANGQLGWELARTCPENVEAVFLTRQDLDISDAEAVESLLAKHNPDAVINAAAYTAVDKAESDQDAAFAINRDGPGNLANVSAQLSAYFLHVSTDFVFDGQQSRPYKVDDTPSPLGVYGESKLAGEQAIQEVGGESAIIRTAWVYSSHGANFVKSMLRLMAEKPALGIVADQVGTPTWARGLAQVCWMSVAKQITGVYHWSDAGAASWYDFSVAIQELSLEKGLLEKAIPVRAIATEDYPTPAQRPSYSILDKSEILKGLEDLENIHWRQQLSAMLDELEN